MNQSKLWAPWRMEYIAEVDSENDCFLCDAANCEEENKKDKLVLWKTNNWVVVMNRWPYNNGHLLIAPHEHIAELDLIDKNFYEEFGIVLHFCKEKLAEVMSPDGFNIGLNIGRIAGAGVEDHLHWHIVPRWNGDTNFMPVLTGTKVIPQSLLALYELLTSDGDRPDT